MSPIQFKFVEKEGTARVATFSDPPVWEVLAERISRMYNIPAADLGISYIDIEGDEITINTNEELQDYYNTIPPMHNNPLKFSVKDIRSNQHPRPLSEVLVDLEDGWTSLPLFPGVPLTPTQLHTSGARIEEIVDEDDEARLSKSQEKEDDDARAFLHIPPQQAQEDEDDASSIDSILEDDLPDKQPIHVFGFTPKQPPARSLSRSSRSSTGTRSLAGSRSVSSTEESHQPDPAFEMLVPEKLKTPSFRHSDLDFSNDTPPAGTHLVDPIRGRSRSRSPIQYSPVIAPRERSISNSSIRSSRVLSEHPSPVIPTIETTSPRGVPASVDVHSIPSPEPIVVPVPPIHGESMLLQETSGATPDPPVPALPPTESTSATTPASLTNDVASLLDALTQAFNEHPELSEGLRTIVRNASQGVYWNNASEAIRSIRDTVVSDAIQARQVIMNESITAARDVSSQAQAEAGRKIADALGNVFRSLGMVLGPDASAASTNPSMESTNARSTAPLASTAPSVAQAQHKEERGRSNSFLGAPRGDSTPLIKATPLIHGQDIPADTHSLSRSSSPSRPDIDASLYPNGGVRVSRRDNKNGYAESQFMPFVWGPSPSQGRGRDRNPFGPPPPGIPVPQPMSPYGFSRHRHHRSQPGSAYPPPPPGPPPPGFFMPPYNFPPPVSPYGYPRFPPPDPRMYMDPLDQSRDYGRDGYPGIGAGANIRRSNTLPSTYAPAAPSVSPPIVPRTETPSYQPPPSQPPPSSQPPSSTGLTDTVPAASTVIIVPSPAPSSVGASTASASAVEKSGSTAVVVPARSKITMAYDQAQIELEEAKQLYKAKKEAFRVAREEKKVEREQEKAERDRQRAERERERERERAERLARRRNQLSGPPPVTPPEPARNPPVSTWAPAPPSRSHYRDSSSDSGTERALPTSPQRSAAGPSTAEPRIERLHKEVFDKLNAMGFTNRSYPQLNTLVPANVRKHLILSKPDLADEILVQNIVEDIFTAPMPPSSSSSRT